jgi:hypothetical protein
LSAAAGLLQGIHTVIAMKRGPHWLLSDTDAKHYGTCLANALRHIPIGMAQKSVDFTMLGIAIFIYEMPRVAMDQAIRQGKAPRERGPAQVFHFVPNPATAQAGQAGKGNGAAPPPEPEVRPEPPDFADAAINPDLVS